MTLLKKYNLELKEVLGDIHIVTERDDFQILAQYLDIWNDAQDIEEVLIEEIDSVLDEEKNDAYVGGGSCRSGIYK